MNDGDAILWAILADPFDDLPRHAYADWLDENGCAARAELIRVQMELARVPAPGADPTVELAKWKGSTYKRYDDLLRRQRELFHDSLLPGGFAREMWLGTLPEWWSRGFVFRVEVTLAEFTAEGFAARLFAAQPVTEVKLRDRTPNSGILSTHYTDGTHNSRHVWSWLEAEQEELESYNRHYVPPDIFQHMEGPRQENPRWVQYDAEKAALADISHGCVNRGRSLLALPPLKHRAK